MNESERGVRRHRHPEKSFRKVILDPLDSFLCHKSASPLSHSFQRMPPPHHAGSSPVQRPAPPPRLPAPHHRGRIGSSNANGGDHLSTSAASGIIAQPPPPPPGRHHSLRRMRPPLPPLPHPLSPGRPPSVGRRRGGRRGRRDGALRLHPVRAGQNEGRRGRTGRAEQITY